MNIIATATIMIFLPIQYYSLGFFASPPKTVQEPVAQVQGAVSENVSKPAENSFKGSLADAKDGNETAGGTGVIPQRKNDFKDIKIFAGSSVVIDADSGTILHYDMGRTKTPIASLTKIMTAVIVMEKVKNLDEAVSIDKEALSADGTKVGCPTSVTCVAERLHLGEKITVKDLLTAMLMDSANDAAIALGKYVGGSQKDFADLMNEKAKELNLADSHFCNPTGLDEDGCYSSAYDVARVAAYSMRYKEIWGIMKLSEASVDSCDGEYTHQLKNTDMLLNQLSNCLGGKTGFTYNAGRSLMIAAVDPETGEHPIVAVIINDNKRWQDMPTLINWAFKNYEWK